MLKSIPSKYLRILPLALIAIYLAFIKGSDSVSELQQMIIVTIMAFISITVLAIIMKRDYDAGKKKLVKQKLIRLAVFLGLTFLILAWMIFGR